MGRWVALVVEPEVMKRLKVEARDERASTAGWVPRPRNNFQRLAVVAAYAEEVVGEEDGVHWDEIHPSS